MPFLFVKFVFFSVVYDLSLLLLCFWMAGKRAKWMKKRETLKSRDYWYYCGYCEKKKSLTLTIQFIIQKSSTTLFFTVWIFCVVFKLDLSNTSKWLTSQFFFISTIFRFFFLLCTFFLLYHRFCLSYGFFFSMTGLCLEIVAYLAFINDCHHHFFCFTTLNTNIVRRLPMVACFALLFFLVDAIPPVIYSIHFHDSMLKWRWDVMLTMRLHFESNKNLFTSFTWDW